MDQILWHPLFNAFNFEEKKQCLEVLIKVSKGVDGRFLLASQNVLSLLIKLLESFLCHLDRELICSCLKLLRSLCAGDKVNQNFFIEHKGVDAILSVIDSVRSLSVLDNEIVRFSLQVLGNVCLAGEEHQLAVWRGIFPNE